MAGDDEWIEEKHYEMLDSHGKAAVDFDLDEYIESGQVLIGRPEDVTEELKAQYDEVGGFGTLFVGAQIGDQPLDHANDNLRRISEEVLPEIKDYADNAAMTQPS